MPLILTIRRVIDVFPHLVLIQPYRVGILPDELVRIHAFDGWRPLDSFLLAVHKDEHVFRASAFFCSLFRSSAFSFGFSVGSGHEFELGCSRNTTLTGR